MFQEFGANLSLARTTETFPHRCDRDTVGVIGGTGAYQNAGGQITVERTLSDGTTDVETLRLILDTD